MVVQSPYALRYGPRKIGSGGREIHEAQGSRVCGVRWLVCSCVLQRRVRCRRKRRSIIRVDRRAFYTRRAQEVVMLPTSSTSGVNACSLVADGGRELGGGDAHERGRREGGRFLVQHDLQALVRGQTGASRAEP